jgi:hypothetical protein
MMVVSIRISGAGAGLCFFFYALVPSRLRRGGAPSSLAACPPSWPISSPFLGAGRFAASLRKFLRRALPRFGVVLRAATQACRELG